MTELSFGRVEAGAGKERRRGKGGGEAGNFAVANCPRPNKTIRQYEHDMTQYECVFFFFWQTLESKIQYYPALLPSPSHSAPCRSVGNDSSHYSQLTWRRLRSFGFCSSSLLLPRPFHHFPSPFSARRSRLEFLQLCELMKLPTIKQENAAVARAINKTVGQHTWRMRNNIEC